MSLTALLGMGRGDPHRYSHRKSLNAFKHIETLKSEHKSTGN